MEQTLTMTDPSLRLLTVKETAEILRVSIPTVYRYIDRGELLATKLSPRKTFITEEDLVTFIKSKKVQP